jgi:hypothetical protein
MKPEQIAKESESSQQVALFAWAAIEMHAGRYPELDRLFHIPNGGTRGATERDRTIAGGKLKAEGVKPGVPDVFLPVARRGYHGLWIEMKKPSLKGTKNPTSEFQDQWIDGLKKNGYACFVAFSWIEARDGIVWYLGE